MNIVKSSRYVLRYPFYASCNPGACFCEAMEHIIVGITNGWFCAPHKDLEDDLAREHKKGLCARRDCTHTHTHTHTHYVNAMTQKASPKALLPGSTVRLPPMNMHAGNDTFDAYKIPSTGRSLSLMQKDAESIEELIRRIESQIIGTFTDT